MIKIVQKCQVKSCKSTEARFHNYYAKGYTGPCGDSFCYASCDLPACRLQGAVLCDKHLRELSR